VVEPLVVPPISTNAAGAPFSKIFRVRRAAFALGDCKNASNTSTDSEVVHFSELSVITRGMSTGLNEARQAVRDALAYREPSHVPIDFGSTAVTGIHVSVVAGPREY
jgi:hypothetical protein